jgi:hypothetical protein
MNDNPWRREIMSRVSRLKTIGRVASLVFLLVATMGPWFADRHPATEETCSPPLVWVGSGYCACLVSFIKSLKDSISNQNSLWLLCLPPALPVLSTLLLLLIGERRWLWVSHLIAWGLVSIYSLFFFIVGGNWDWYSHRVLILWGAGLCGVVAVAILVEETLVGKSPTLNESA